MKQRFKLVDGKELHDLLADPGEQKDVAAEHPDVVARMRSEYEAWFKDVTSARRFDPAPKIVLGSSKQNPVTLTRQDWRGPNASWNADAVGHWEVSFAKDGNYELTVRFAPLPSDAELKMKVAGTEEKATLSKGAERHTFAAAKLPAGDTRIEPTLVLPQKTVGVQYVDVKRID